MIDYLTQLSSWLVFLAALGVALQNFIYLRRNCSRRQSTHFAFLVLALYMSGLYLMAATTPTIWLIRSGIATKIGIMILLWMIYSITRMDAQDERQETK